MEAIRRTLQHGDTLGWGVGDTREQMLCDVIGRERASEGGPGVAWCGVVVGKSNAEEEKGLGLVAWVLGRLIEA